MFTNTPGAIIPVVIQNTPPELSGWTTKPSQVLLAMYTWLLFSQFLSALLLATHVNQITQQWIHVTPPSLLLPLGPTLQQRIRAAKPLTPRLPLTAPLSLLPHCTTHTHTPLGSHVPSSNHTIHVSLMNRSTSEAQLHQI